MTQSIDANSWQPASVTTRPVSSTPPSAPASPVNPGTGPLHLEQDSTRMQQAPGLATGMSLEEPIAALPSASQAESGQRRGIGSGLYDVDLAPGTRQQRFFGENDVPFSAIVVNSETIQGDALDPAFIARAAIKANPDIQLVVPTRQPFDGPSDTRFQVERSRLAERLGVPEANILPVRSDMAAFPQDEFLAGTLNGKPTLFTPNDRADRTDFWLPDEDGIPDSTHWARNVTRDGAAMLAKELGVQSAVSDFISEGGDTQFLTRPDGTQAAVFSSYTVNKVARTLDLDVSSPGGFLKALDKTMVGMRAAGIPVDAMAPVGTGKVTYREALDAMAPEDRAALDPEVRARFEALGDLKVPQRSYVYHSDLTVLSPDGKTAFVSEYLAKADPSIERQLRAAGFEPKQLPGFQQGFPVKGQADQQVEGWKQWEGTQGGPTLSYINTVMGKMPDGRPVILMPTEAADPDRLTARDQQAMAAFRQVQPDAVIVPVGGRSAVTAGRNTMGTFEDGTELGNRNWGIHCMTNVLPFRMQVAGEAGSRP
ncbi:MAG: hypothetical protein VKP57_03755 [Candidatus Sericytochromatia bacterium]|nr:hypothetical protein [Candidatus Sericytochromatia bacterium]